MTQASPLACDWEPRVCRGIDLGAAPEPTSGPVFAGIGAVTQVDCIAAPVNRGAGRRVSRGPAIYSVLLFAVSAALTILWSAFMPAMPGMPMPGGWTMSMAWMRMPGQPWAGAAASFVGMWVVMMAAMMSPSLAPMLWRYRRGVSTTGQPGLGRLTTLAALGYFFVWTLAGMAVFPVGAAAAALEMERPVLARAVPLASGLLVVAAGAFQFTKWKANQLTCCREAPGARILPADSATAWRQGMDFGLDCTLSCANLTAVLLVLGVMDLYAMAGVTAAITAERLAPAGERVARAIGAVLVGAGWMLIARATGLP